MAHEGPHTKRSLHYLYRQVKEGKKAATPGGLGARDLKENKHGVIVSRARSDAAKSSPWLKHVKAVMSRNKNLDFGAVLKLASQSWRR